MLKGSGLIRVHPRLNARTHRAVAAASSQAAPTLVQLLWSGAGLLCLASIGTIIAVLVVTHIIFPEDVPDVFAPYQFLDHSPALADLGSSACLARTISPYTHEEQCDLRLVPSASDIFQKVTISLHGSHVGAVRFQCHNLYVGDLVGRWGRPDQITRVRGGFLLTWTHKDIVAQVRGSQWFNYLLPVDTVIHI